MRKPRISQAFALLFVLFITVSAVTPAAFNGGTINAVQSVNTHQPAATNYVVTIRTFNDQMAFNDDDFEFVVRNGTAPLNNAWVRLYNISTQDLLYQEFTDGNGLATFSNLPVGTYQWNVSHPLAVGTPDATGQIVSDGPEANVNILFGNLDWDNDEDDLNATITDIELNPAYNLNFSIMFQSNNSLWAQVSVTDGSVSFSDIPDGLYYWELRVLGDPVYDGYLLETAPIVANGTQLLVRSRVGPLTGDPDYYDLEVFTYYETSLVPLMGANVTVMFKNGTVYDTRLTPANGTVLFADLPVAFMNWTVRYGGQPVGAGDYYRNLTTVSTDLRAPVIVTPGDQEYLVTAENVTITWHVEDEHPGSLEVFVNGGSTISVSWVNTTYDFVYNVSEYFPSFDIGEYNVRLVATDLSSNVAEDTITLKVYENVTPVLEGPDPVEFFFSETGYTLSWNVTDEYPDMYNVTDNGERYTNGSINPDAPTVTISLDGLSVGVHNFTIYVNDTSGNTASDWVLVTVNGDTIPPVVVYAPDDIYYPQGDRVPVKNWTITDDFKDYYTISVDGVVVVTEDWTDSIIEFDFSGLQVGVHNVTLTVYDLGGNSVSSTVQVFVSTPTIQRYMIGAGIGVAVLIGVLVVVWFVKFR
ncbi:MAG: hypothetical protein DRP09_00155 [Candidatus Thorarchaeota archaeon]|nr:MAG: hypothetical protein DRP09_00155 [Candidatus Thorarchaeota archaeon]